VGPSYKNLTNHNIKGNIFASAKIFYFKRLKMKKLILVLLIVPIVFVLIGSFKEVPVANSTGSPSLADTVQYPDERHFGNVQQLTFGGDNAEAYFSYDGKWLIFQKTNPKEGISCDQMFIGKVPAPGEKFEYKLVSTGKGRTTCGFFTKDGKHVIYASTHLGADACPPVPDSSKYGNKYIWPLY
jgi:TolB protein